MSDYINSVEVFTCADFDETPASVWEKYPVFFINSERSITPGFISGSLWIALTICSGYSKEKIVIDLGPEIVDRADLYVVSPSGDLIHADSTGRHAQVGERKVLSWRSALLVPQGQKTVLVRVTSSDSVHLNLRGFILEDFYSQTNLFTFFHALVFGITLVIMLFLLVSALFFKDRLFLLLFVTNLCFLIYQCAMKGFIHTYAPFFAQNSFLITRLSYIACASGFAFGILLISKCIQFTEKNDPMRVCLRTIITAVLFFIALYIFLPELGYLYEISLIVLICGCLIIGIFIFLILVIRKKMSAGLLAVWIPLLYYVVFRQSYHIARLYHDFPRLERLFEYDYYYGYDLCLLFQLLVYTWLIYKQAQETRRVLLMENERAYFFTTMSHELIAPSAMVLQAADELKQKIPNSENVENLLQSIQGNVTRIRETSVLINSLEEQEQHIYCMLGKEEPISPSEILSSILSDYGWYAEIHHKPIQCAVTTTDCVQMNPLFLKSIFSNLIDNAVKYGAENFPITIELNREGDSLCFSVHSCGIVISEKDRRSLFDLRYRGLWAQQSESPGFGVGLHLVKRIAKLYNGTIHEDPTANGAGVAGTRFTVLLKPVFASQAETEIGHKYGKDLITAEKSTLPPNISSLLARSVILLVDDDMLLLQRLYEYFIPYCKVITSVDGIDAFEKMNSIVPDIVICDFHMPRMNGIKLKEKCQQNQIFDAIPFLFLTAAYNEHDIKRAYDGGFVDFIRKPVQFEELRNKVFALLQLCEQVRRKKTSTILELIQNGLPSLPANTHAEQEKKAFAYRQSLYETYGLSPAEKRVCEIFISDTSKTNREIAEELCCAVDTASSHLKSVYKKMPVKDRIELAVLLHDVK